MYLLVHSMPKAWAACFHAALTSHQHLSQFWAYTRAHKEMPTSRDRNNTNLPKSQITARKVSMERMAGHDVSTCSQLRSLSFTGQLPVVTNLLLEEPCLDPPDNSGETGQQ